MPPFSRAGRIATPPAASNTADQGRRQRGLARRFLGDRSGSVAMTFGLLVIPLTAFIGLAVDFGKAYSVNSHTQSALDGAALAAGRVAQVETTDIINKASAAATAYFNQGKPTNVVSSTIVFSPNADKTQFTVTATSWVRTPFLGVLNSLFNKGSQAGAPASCQGNYYGCVQLHTTSTAELKVGGNGGSNVEVSLMLDVTGSMCSPCTKIQAVQSAAKDLIDIVVWDDQSQFTSRIGLAPFAEAVNVGTTLAPLVRGAVTNNAQGSPQVLNCASMTNTATQPTNKWIKYPQATSNTCKDSGNGATPTVTWQISSKCVTERIGAQAYTDAPPTTAFVGKGYFGTNTDTSCGVANHTDAEVNSIQPLSSDKTMLKRRIDKLTTAGSTAGHLGTAWAWYLLSPKWNYLFPVASAAGPYSDLAALNSQGLPKLRKIAVLMTDGDYNINYCKGTEAKNSDQSPDIDCNSENGKSQAQATTLCTALKTAQSGGKIEVFTVGFQVSAAAKTFLTSCATDASHYYDATTEDALKAAFRDIALKISTLRLTN
jgi:Flp pilus assembly protein TadG